MTEREQLLQTLFESSPDAIFIEDLNGIVLDCNPAAADLHRGTCEELIGKNVRDLVPANRRDELVTFSSHGPIEFEGWSLTLDGKSIPVSVRTSRIDYMGQPAILLHVRDISERKREMEAVGRLAGGVAHDFNNLMTVIIGRCDVLLERMTPDHPMRPEVLVVHHAAEKSAAITRQLLAFSRRQVLRLRVLDLNAIIRNMDMILRSVITANVQFSLDLSPALRTFAADRGQIEQVIMNLVINSLDAMPNGGELIIRTENSGDGIYVTLTVEDTGVGMDAQTLSHIFEPFFTTKHRSTGTGLGLSTVYGIIRQSGGYVSAESEPGGGTTFKIALPGSDLPAEPLDPPQPQAPPGTETILVAEDDDMVRSFTREILEARGYTVLEARDGEGALQICKSHDGTIDLALTDVALPRLNGTDFARNAAAIRPEMRIVFMSGYNEEISRSALTGVRFIEKPFTSNALAIKIREALDES